jgi:hypothetical protein
LLFQPIHILLIIKWSPSISVKTNVFCISSLSFPIYSSVGILPKLVVPAETLWQSCEGHIPPNSLS